MISSNSTPFSLTPMSEAENSTADNMEKPEWANSADQTIDAAGLACPMPLLKLKMALNAAAKDTVICVISTDVGSRRDIPAYAKLAKLACWIEDRPDQTLFWVKNKKLGN